MEVMVLEVEFIIRCTNGIINCKLDVEDASKQSARRCRLISLLARSTIPFSSFEYAKVSWWGTLTKRKKC